MGWEISSPNILQKFGFLDLQSIDCTIEKRLGKAEGLQAVLMRAIRGASVVKRDLSQPQMLINTSDALKFIHVSYLFPLEKCCIER